MSNGKHSSNAIISESSTFLMYFRSLACQAKSSLNFLCSVVAVIIHSKRFYNPHLIVKVSHLYLEEGYYCVLLWSSFLFKLYYCEELCVVHFFGFDCFLALE